MHQCIKFILFWNDTLHVSDGLSFHHQEFKTVHTATGICQTDTAVCLLASRQQYLFDVVRTVWRSRFGRGCVPVVRVLNEWMNEWMNDITSCVLNIRNNQLVIQLQMQVIQLQAYHKAVVLAFWSGCWLRLGPLQLIGLLSYRTWEGKH